MACYKLLKAVKAGPAKESRVSAVQKPPQIVRTEQSVGSCDAVLPSYDYVVGRILLRTQGHVLAGAAVSLASRSALHICRFPSQLGEEVGCSPNIRCPKSLRELLKTPAK